MKKIKILIIAFIFASLVIFFNIKPLVIDFFVCKDAQAFIENKFPLQMIYVKSGTLIKEKDKKLGKSVAISDFYIQQTEITQAQWQAIMAYNPSRFVGSNRPVESVSWDSVQVFIEKLNKLTGKQYRLPTVDEWEYAAGGGDTKRTLFAGTNCDSEIKDYAVFLEHRPIPISLGGKHWGIYGWFQKNVYGGTSSVAHKKPNQLDLYDMSGNVNEWCSDSCANENGYTDRLKIVKGGSFADCYMYCRVKSFNKWYADKKNYWVGFRLVMDK